MNAIEMVTTSHRSAITRDSQPHTPSNRIVTRKASIRDTPAIEALIALRTRVEGGDDDEARPPVIEAPGRRMWGAFDGERAIGMSSVLARELRSGDRHVRAAYWTGLFIDPGYRTSLIYPRLLSEMFSGLREEGFQTIYAAVRRRRIAEAHLRIGFERIAELKVLAEPLRPARLLAKYVRPNGSAALDRVLAWSCAPIDALFGLQLGLRARLRGVPIFDETPFEATIARWLAARHAEAAEICQRSTVDSLAERYGAEPDRYRVAKLIREDRIASCAVLCVVERRGGVRAAVILDLGWDPTMRDARAETQLFAAVQQIARRERCDVVLLLDGSSATDGDAARRAGYLESPERYTLLLRRDKANPVAAPCLDRAWRFVFGDHDTF